MRNVRVVVFAGRWDRNLLLPAVSGKLHRDFPEGTVKAGETPEDAACRLTKRYGLPISPSDWLRVAEGTEDGSPTLLATRAAQSDFVKSAALGEKSYWTQTELTLCDAWVNPNNFMPTLLSTLEQARHVLNAADK